MNENLFGVLHQRTNLEGYFQLFSIIIGLSSFGDYFWRFNRGSTIVGMHSLEVWALDMKRRALTLQNRTREIEEWESGIFNAAWIVTNILGITTL